MRKVGELAMRRTLCAYVRHTCDFLKKINGILFSNIPDSKTDKIIR